MLTLEARKRDKKEDSQKIKRDNEIPAVFYGPKEESTSVAVKFTDFLSLYDKVGESSVFALKDGEKEHEALIHQVQFDAVSGKPIHVDFYIIEKGKKINVSVPLNFIGVSPAEKTLGGVLVKVVHEVDIEALPKDLPHEIDVSLESLVDFDSQIKAKDIKLPEGVDLDMNPDEVIALVQEPKEEEEEAPAVDLDSIEVEKKGKEESAEPANEQTA